MRSCGHNWWCAIVRPLSVMVGLVERPAMDELTNPNLIDLESELCLVVKKVQENLEKFFILFFVVIFKKIKIVDVAFLNNN